MDTALEGLRGLGRAPGLADDATARPSSSGRMVRSQPAPADLPSLPQVVHETIATAPGMNPRHRAAMAGTHPALGGSLRVLLRSDRAVARGRDVTHLTHVSDALQDVRSVPLDRLDLRARPLAVLAGRLGRLEDDPGPAFDAILATITQAPAQHRRPMDSPLMMLAGQVTSLEPADQAGAFQRLLQAQEPPGSQAAGLHLLAGRMGDLPEAARPQAPTQVLRWAGQLEPGPARELAGHLPDLPEAAQEPALSGLLLACSSHVPDERTETLKDLAGSSGWLSGPVRAQAMREVLSAAESLSPEQRWAVLKPLAQGIYRLPVPEQEATWRAVVRSYLAVPPAQVAAALAQLHDQVMTLPNAEGGPPAVFLMPAVLGELPAALRQGEALSEAHHTLLLMCAQALVQMPPAGRQGLFQHALDTLPRLREEHRVPLLKEWAKAIAVLPALVRPHAVRGVLAAAETLAPAQRWAALKPLCKELHQLPVPDQASSWQAIVRAYLAVPPGQLAEALAQVHGRIKKLSNAGEEQEPEVPLMPAVLREMQAWAQQRGALPPEARCTVLLMSAQELGEVPQAERQVLFGLVLRGIPGLPEDRRGPLLDELAQAIAALPAADRLPQWQATLQAVEQLPQQQGVRPFGAVAAQIDVLPVDARAAAFESLLQAHGKLQARDRVLSMTGLGTGCLALPRVEWPLVLGRVLAEWEQIPERDLRALGLLALARPFCLAEPAAINPLAPAQPDRPGPDVRVQCVDKILERMPLRPHPPAEFAAYVNALNDDVERQLRQQPLDAAVLTQVLERLRGLR